MREVFAIVLCLLAGSVVAAGREALALRVSPSVSMAPATVRIVVTVEPDAQNRQLEIEADSGQFYTSSTVQLDGSNAPRLRSFVFNDLPAGEYQVTARVVRAGGSTRSATGEYQVME